MLPGDPPGGSENEEFATDLCTVYLGFGLFSANTAFRFSQYRDFESQGWQYARQGYLKEREWAFALAVFFTLRGDDPAPALTYLKASLRSDTKRCLKYLARIRKSCIPSKLRARQERRRPNECRNSRS